MMKKKTPKVTPVIDVSSPPSMPDTASVPITCCCKRRRQIWVKGGLHSILSTCKSFSSQSFRGGTPLPVPPPSFPVLAAFFFTLHFSCFTLLLDILHTVLGMSQKLLIISAILFHAWFIICLVRSLDGVVDDEKKDSQNYVSSPPSMPNTTSVPISCKSFSSQSFREGRARPLQIHSSFLPCLCSFLLYFALLLFHFVSEIIHTAWYAANVAYNLCDPLQCVIFHLMWLVRSLDRG